jgi:hypothetical protein
MDSINLLKWSRNDEIIAEINSDDYSEGDSLYIAYQGKTFRVRIKNNKEKNVILKVIE